MLRLELPVVTAAAAYEHCFNDNVWAQAAASICARHQIPYRKLCRSPQGENISFLVDDKLVIKIFAPFRQNYQRELAALEFAHGKLSLNTPQVRSTGELEGWS